MKIAVSSLGENLESPFDYRLNNASHVLILDSQNLQCKELPIKKPSELEIARSLIDKGVNVVVTGDCNEKTSDYLSEAHIRIYSGKKGSVKDNVLAFYKKKLLPALTDHYTVEESQNAPFANPTNDELWEIIPGYIPDEENEL
jgi:predicted Fe-Mo cluster-binding NifX family protein